MSSQNNSGGSGIGLTGATFLVFLVLKLIGVINWSWWWVTAPLWIPAGVGFLFLIAFLIVWAVKGD